MQAGIPDWEESKKDRRTVLREEKTKKEKMLERVDTQERNYSEGIVGQWSYRIGNEFGVYI